MAEKIEKLKADIARLEEIIQKDHFSGLVDKSRSEKNRNRLIKLQKELKQLEEQA